jgi:hypothetical protein
MNEKFCPICGIEVSPDARFCNQCGEPLVIEKPLSLKEDKVAIVSAALGKVVQLAEELRDADGKVRKLVDDVCTLLKLALDDRDFTVIEVKGWTEREVYSKLVKCTIDGTSHFDREKRINRFLIRPGMEDRVKTLIGSVDGFAGSPEGPASSKITFQERVPPSRRSLGEVLDQEREGS